MLCATRSDRATCVCLFDSIYIYRSFYYYIFFLLIRGTERHTATFRHCTKQKSFEIITKSEEKSPNKVSAHSFEWFVSPHGKKADQSVYLLGIAGDLARRHEEYNLDQSRASVANSFSGEVA